MSSRTIFLRGLRISIVLSSTYFLLVGLAAVHIYKNKSDTLFTRSVEYFFPYPAAIVNKEIIPLSRFRKEVSARKMVAKKNNTPVNHADVEKSVADRLITRVFYNKAVADAGITISDQEVEASVQSVYKQIGGKENLAKFLQEEYGNQMTVPDFRVLTKEFLVQTALEKQLLVHAQVRHILVAFPENADPATIETSKNQLLKAKAQLSDPAKFADVAKQFSEDLASRDKGGDLGSSTRGEVAKQFSQDFEDAVFTIPLRQVSDPIRSKFGWHLIVVDNRGGSINQSLAGFTAEQRAKAKVALFVAK